jgi:hypothetical protein
MSSESAGSLVVPQQSNTCHVVKNVFWDNVCDGDCPGAGKCVWTDWRLKQMPYYALVNSGIQPRYPRDYESTDCGCKFPTRPVLCPAPPPPRSKTPPTAWERYEEAIRPLLELWGFLPSGEPHVHGRWPGGEPYPFEPVPMRPVPMGK